MRHWSRAAALTVVVVVGGLGLSACDWRVETPPIERRTPTPAVALRDQAALREQAVIDAEGTGAAAALEAELAPVRLAALGGVYVATPGATPSPSVSPSASATTEAASWEATVAAARDEALEAAAETDDASLAALLRSIALSHELALWVPGASSGAASAAVEERPMPEAPTGAELVPASDADVSADDLASLAVAHDSAGFVYETAAARSTGDTRTAALERARIHRARAEALVTLDGVTDLREELYTVDTAMFADEDSRAAGEKQIETSLGWNYAALASTATAADANWLLNAAFDAYAAAAVLPGGLDVPALPGITQS